MNQRGGIEHALSLGKLVGNLLSLEMAARLAVAKLDPAQNERVLTQLPQVKEGDWVDVDPFTNTADLRQTLEKYNKAAPQDYRLEINRIVRLRDALAHGRMFGFGPATRRHLRLLKFGIKPKDKRVQVTMVVDMTPEWFKDNLQILMAALEKLTRALDYERRDLPS